MELLFQNDFGGGMNATNPAPNQYMDGRNIVIRDGTARTRQGIRRTWYANQDGQMQGFYFNQEDAKYNDATHTGFWFPWNWSSDAWTEVQGVGIFRWEGYSEKFVIAAGGKIYKHGYMGPWVTEVPCVPAIDSSETVTFLQAENYVYMFRSGDNHPMRWSENAVATGFLPVPSAAVGDDIPHFESALWHPAGRMWGIDGMDDVWASDILDRTEWDSTYQRWSIKEGDGDQLMALATFNESTIIAFKRRSISALTNVNAVVSAVATAAGYHFSDFIAITVVDNDVGLVAKDAWVNVGEDIWFLGYGGIYSFRRNQQNKIERQAEAVSKPIQPYIDRINWDYIDCACATVHDNYVMFAVPLDRKQENNALLVYDLLAPAGNGKRGAWCGVWDSKSRVLSVKKWVKPNWGKMCAYWSEDGAVRRMFHSSPTDSAEPYRDADAWDASTWYDVGDVVYSSSGGDFLYTCIVPCKNVAVTETAHWTVATDASAVFNVETYIETRHARIEPARQAGRFQRGEIMFRHRNPKLTVDAICDDYATDTNVVTDQTYSQTKYETADTADWVQTTANDFHNPHRQDYALIMPVGGLYLDDSGWYLDKWKQHNITFALQRMDDRELGFKLTNTQGEIDLVHVAVPVTPHRWAAKNTA